MPEDDGHRMKRQFRCQNMLNLSIYMQRKATYKTQVHPYTACVFFFVVHRAATDAVSGSVAQR